MSLKSLLRTKPKKLKLAASTTSFEGSKKTNFRLIIYSHSSTNPENLAKIGPVILEIIGLILIGIVKNKERNRRRTQ